MIGEVQQRLRDQVPALRLVEGAAQFAALAATPPDARLPAAYVMAASDEAGPNSLATMKLRQAISRTIRVVLFARNLRDDRGDAAAADVEALVGQVREALVGWQPAGATRWVELRGGRLLGFVNQVVSWGDDYSCTFHLERTLA
jgi:hypothetical protein